MRWLHRQMAFCLAASGCCGSAFSQTGGLIRPIRIDSYRGYVEAGYELERQGRESPTTGSSFDQDEKTLLLGLSGDLKGSFLNPALLPFSFGGTLRRRMTDIETTGGRNQGDRDQDASQFRVQLGIVPVFKWSGQLFVSRFLQDIDSTFAPRRSLLRQDERLVVSNESQSWRVRFDLGRFRAKGLEGDPRDETRNRVAAHVGHVQRNATTRLDGEVLDYEEGFSRQDYRLGRISANQSWRPGGSPKLVLNGTLDAFDRSGTSEFSSVLVGQGVEWHPLQDLRVLETFSVQNQEDLQGSLATRHGATEVQHTLWGSLTMRLRTELDRDSLPGEGTRDVDQASLDFDYYRHLTRGTLYLQWGRRLRLDDEELPARRSLVREDQLFQLGVPILLQQPSILPGTVLVTDPLGATVYVEGIDYELVALGDLLELRVLPGGLIQAGDTLRISYAVESSPSFHVRSLTKLAGGSWRGRSGVWVRTVRSHLSQLPLDGVEDGRIDQSLEQEYGAGIDRKRWRLSALSHSRDSRILAFRMRQYEGSFTQPLGRFSELTLRARRQRTTFPEREDDVRFQMGGLNLRVNLGKVRMDAFFERWDETIAERRGKYFQGDLVARWMFRRLELLLQGRSRTQNVDVSGKDRLDEVRFLVRRTLR